MSKVVDPALINHSVKLYVAGRNGAEVCRETGISHSVLFRHLKKQNIPIRPRTVVDEKALCRIYVRGVSCNAVAQQFGIERIVVDRILREHGIERRGRSEAERLKWRGMNRAKRKAQVAAAHAASKGHIKSLDTLCQMAATRERNLSCQTSPYEADLVAMLEERGIVGARQKAIGPYNCDFAAASVAVEVWGGHWHWHGPHRSRVDDRFRYIMNAGWNILAIPVNASSALTLAVADYVAAYIEETRRNPPAVCEYRVVWGCR